MLYFRPGFAVQCGGFVGQCKAMQWGGFVGQCGELALSGGTVASYGAVRCGTVH